MLNLNLNEIYHFIKNKKCNKNYKIQINNISTNSKKIFDNTIFIALSGIKFNGHDFIEEAIQNGAIAIICNKNYIISKKYNIPFIFVNNTYNAIGILAKKYREIYLKNVKIIAITGSVGKTTTKEIISNILSTKYKICKTKKNFNNFIGVTQTIFNIDKNDDIAIVEFGMSHKYEIDCLANITKPNITIITNIGLAHIENFDSKQEILKAKLEITNYLKKDDIFIYNNDDNLLNNIKIDNFINKYYNIAINNNINSNIYADNIVNNQCNSSFDIYFNNKIYIKNCKLNIAGKHNIYNALFGILIGKIFNISISNIKNALFNFKNIDLRQKVYNSYNNNIFIEDCYNASPESMKASFNIIQQYSKLKKILILGKMNELGNFSKENHVEIGLLASKISDLIIFVGYKNDIIDYTTEIQNKEKYIIFENCDEVVDYLYIQNFKNSVFLIKGSRTNKMEQIILKYHPQKKI